VTETPALAALRTYFHDEVAGLRMHDDAVGAQVRASAMALLTSGGGLTFIQRSLFQGAATALEHRPPHAFPHTDELRLLARFIVEVLTENDDGGRQ
jgi:hypothetical protein